MSRHPKAILTANSRPFTGGKIKGECSRWNEYVDSVLFKGSIAHLSRLPIKGTLVLISCAVVCFQRCSTDNSSNKGFRRSHHITAASIISHLHVSKATMRRRYQGNDELQDGQDSADVRHKKFSLTWAVLFLSFPAAACTPTVPCRDCWLAPASSHTILERLARAWSSTAIKTMVAKYLVLIVTYFISQQKTVFYSRFWKQEQYKHCWLCSRTKKQYATHFHR